MRQSIRSSLGSLLVGIGLGVDGRPMQRLQTAVEALVARVDEAERNEEELTRSLEEQSAIADRKDANIAKANEQLGSLLQRANQLQINNELYEALIFDNNDRASRLILMTEGRVAFGELRAKHDRFFEVVVTVLNASIFRLYPQRIDGRIEFGGRLMFASTIEIVHEQDFPVRQGSFASFTIRVVPVQTETIEAVLGAAKRSETVEMDLSQLHTTFSGDDGREYRIQLFQGITEWRSDIYEPARTSC